uniref:Sodium-coupled monocarboxylate transporter 2 n=1 Tax=Angiostrongylus cantonensis TaxID=6313 RepID=A0A0K0CV91_ANGCA
MIQYNSVWINLVSGTITWVASFGVNQLAIQRYASLPTLKQAQQIIYYTLVPFFILCSVVAFIGFIALAYFYNCNPLETGQILETDHITILFAKDILLFRKSECFHAVVVACGITSTLLAFSAAPLGGILRVCVSVLGAISGPIVGIFVLAMFFPRSGFWSCILSFVISNIIMVFVCIANYVEDPYRDLFLPTNSSIEGCGSSNFTVRHQPPYDTHYGDPTTMFISRISTYSYAGVGFIIMMTIGVSINFVKSEQEPEKIRHLTFTGRK